MQKKTKIIVFSTITLTLILFIVVALVFSNRCHYTSFLTKWFNTTTINDKAKGDTIPPTVYALPIEVKVGEHPDYRKNLRMFDNSKVVKLHIDSSQVNTQQPGDYIVKYIVSDTTGNSTTKNIPVQVYDPNHKIIYLTFDDGPSVNTPKILQILRENNVHATFFITAQWPQCLPYITQAYKEGNAIAAHSYTHNFDIYKSEKAYFDDLEKIEQVIEKYTGHRTPLIRFPGGSSNKVSKKRFGHNIMPTLMKKVMWRGYQFIDWNIDSEDARSNHVPVATLVRNACHDYHPRLCLLMHDAGGKGTTVEALPYIISYFKSKGYDFGTITSPAFYCHHNLANIY